MSSIREYQKCTLKMKAWTHVHIGSGRILGRWEYFFKEERTEGGNKETRLYMLDYKKLSQVAMRDPGFIDSMTRAAQGGGKNSLNEFLMTQKQVRDEIGSYPRGLPKELSSLDSAAINLTELMLFAGSPFCYLPGSSLKGVLRTPYIAAQVRSGKIELSRDRREMKSRLAKGFDLKSEDNQVFQHVVLRDSPFFKSTDMGVASVKIFANDGKQKSGSPARGQDSGRSKQKQNQDIFCEVLLSDTSFTMDLLLRTGRLQGKHFNSIDDLLKSADEFYRRVWNEERANRTTADGPESEVAKFYNESDCRPPDNKYLLRIGYGSGQMATSILVDYRDKFKNEFDVKADEPLRNGSAYGPNGPPHKRNRTPYPYTAKSAVADDFYVQPLGWVVVDKNLEVTNVD